MHGCDSWCFQSSYHLLPSFVGPLICHTNFSPSPRDTSEVFHVEAGKGSIFTSKTFGPCQGKLCPQRWSWLDLKVNFCSSFFVERWTCLPKKKSAYPFCLNYQKERRVVSHLPSTWSFNQPKKYDMTKLGGFKTKIKEDNDNMKPFSQGKYPSNIHGCKALRCLSHQLRASTQTCNPSATCQSAKLLLMVQKSG